MPNDPHCSPRRKANIAAESEITIEERDGMKKTQVFLITMLLITVIAAEGVVPQKWELLNFEQFLQGKFEGVSVSYEGVLSLSPKEDILEGPGEEFFLSLLLDSEGEAFLGTGHGGEIYKMTNDGKFELYFQVPEMDVYCLAKDAKGNLYAGTSPNGQIWKITEKGKGDVFFNPQERYIWALNFTKKGNLLAAVGESGGIYEINQDGVGNLILKANENHILCMEWAGNGDLIAGSGGKGLVYRISEDNKASVLYESPYEEIKSIAIDREGNIYAASGGQVILPETTGESASTVLPATDVSITVTAAPALPVEDTLSGRAQPSSVIKINTEGIGQALWESKNELIYTLFWDERKEQIVFGTGPNGRIYAIDKEKNTSLLVQKDSEQIYLLSPSQDKIFTLSNNPSSFSILQQEQRFEGEYTSRIFDTKILSSWGRIEWQVDVPEGANLQLQTRSGNSKEPNSAWSEWSPPYSRFDGEQILSPKARYIQFRVLFKALSGRETPKLQKVALFFLQTNVAPTVSGVEILPVNEVFLKPMSQEEQIWGLYSSPAEEVKKEEEDNVFVVAKKVVRKGYQTIRWAAEDQNSDKLLFDVLIRNEAESRWRILKRDWMENIFVFDTLSFPDGNYFIKVEAVDSPSNPRGMELKSEKVSRQLTIDNSLPLVRNVSQERKANALTITFTVEDSFSYVQDVQFLIRPNEWQSVFPKDGICDSKREEFEITVSLPSGFDDLLTIKATDSRGNTGVSRQIIK